jgi:exo-beta-1,3-glucanase (GH17 family)
MNQVLPLLRRHLWLSIVGLGLALTGCGGSQNWSNNASYVSIGGTVSGLNGGSVVLANNGSDPLTVSANGAFTFALKIAPNAPYAVTVRTQPEGAVCSVTSGGTGTAAFNVTNVAVTCLPDVTVGGTATGLNGGIVVLQNNGANDLAVGADGSFTFAQKIHDGGAYAVTVKTPPNGELCSVTNGSGTASGAVTSVAVNCSAFVRRPLPAIYRTGKAVAYSAYRSGGPGVGEMPTDDAVLQDLSLLHTAGFNLLRLFGSDNVAQKMISLAQANYPEMRFQLGIYLEGAPASCVDSVNQSQINKAISLANAYSNVVSVSIGNETSFAGNLPASCLASYVLTVRGQVQQAVTADDDYTFYAGLTSSGEKPDLVLPLLDFVSIHTYPLSNAGRWDWQQLSVATGPGRAVAMMNAALQNAVTSYNSVANYLYRDINGNTVTIGNSLPIVIGETGWKATQTNGNSLIELFTANQINQKWYFDLLNGWQAAGTGPVSIFYFEAFDEAWKGTDDGWGLWDASRTPRYALCGTPAGDVCNNPVYDGAGYYP